MAASNFSLGRGHWSVQTGVSDFQVILSACRLGGPVALRKNAYNYCLKGQGSNGRGVAVAAAVG